MDLSFFSQNPGGSDFAQMCLKGGSGGCYRSYFIQHTYSQGQCVHAPGEEITHFGIVTHGILEAVSYSGTGKELCDAYFAQGDSFPELLYLTGSRRYTYLLRAGREAAVAWIPIDILDKMLGEDSELMGALLCYVSRRGLQNQLYLNCLNYQTIRERVAYWVVGIQRLEPRDAVSLPPSQTVFANLIHVSRASLNQELKQMERSGYFRLEKGAMYDVDTEGLTRLL